MVHPAGRAERPRVPLASKREQIRRVAGAMDAVASDTPGGIFKMAVDVHYGGIVETVADCKAFLNHAGKVNSGLCLK